MIQTYRDIIRNCYQNLISCPGGADSYYNQNSSLTESNFFSCYYEVDLNKDILEIPCFCLQYVILKLTQIREGSNSAPTNGIIRIPIINNNSAPHNSQVFRAKSANPLLKRMFYTDFNSLLCTVYGNDTRYEGGKGIVMHADRTPLVVFSAELTKQPYENTYKYNITKFIVRINPIVFRREDILAKHIRTKMLSNLYEEGASFGGVLGYRRGRAYILDDVTIKDFEVKIEPVMINLFKHPQIPNVTTSQESIENMLSSNLDTIIRVL